MFAKVVAQSVPSIEGTLVTKDYPSTSENLAGLFANVCYSSGYDIESIDDKLQKVDANHDRFDRVAGTFHHSIADHANISVYLGGIGKMTAMVLNSLEYYATSERSGRYTDMSKNASPDEYHYYTKWSEIISKRIEKEYPQIDANRRKKLTQENARYLIDVTSPYTSMVYTTTYRQWSYIAQWFTKFLDITSAVRSPFMTALHRDLRFIRDFILSEKIGSVDKLLDVKDRGLNFLTTQVGSMFPDREQIGRMYTVMYDCTFPCLAHLQRHRTITYLMQFDDADVANYRFYVPEIIKDLSDDWNTDMQNLVKKGYTPNGILVRVAEMGDVSKFILKCKERLCGRAQIEIAMLTKETLDKLYINMLGNTRLLLQDMYLSDQHRCKAKCELIGQCSEACEFGPVNAVNRII